jgi:hypothetical protein
MEHLNIFNKYLSAFFIISPIKLILLLLSRYVRFNNMLYNKSAHNYINPK